MKTKEEIVKQRMEIMEKHMAKTEKSDCFEVFFDYQKAMQEYSDQNTQLLIDEIAELKSQFEQSDKMYSDLLAKKDDFKFKWENAENEIAKLKASKSEANDAVEFLDWSYMNAAFDSENGLHKWQTMDKRNLTTTELYEIFKTRNNK